MGCRDRGPACPVGKSARMLFARPEALRAGMRFLHTGDWHAGKKLGRVDRTREFEAVFDEIVDIARDQKVDCVLVAGDIFDRALPSLDSLRLVIEALQRLASVTGSVVAIPGNHDSPALFEVLAPLLAPSGVVLASRIRRPDEGGIVKVTSRDGRQSADVAVFPFLHESQVVDFMDPSSEWFNIYAEKTGQIARVLCDAFRPGAVGILTAHFFVDGSEIAGDERKITIGRQYAATNQSLPPQAAYVALGHIHRPQAIPGAASPARYSGSLLQLDFSERTHNKEVVVVDAKPGIPAKVKSIQLSSGRKLLRLTEDLETLRRLAEGLKDAYLDVRVKTSGPRFGLFEEVRQFLPNAVMVRAEYERAEADSNHRNVVDSSFAELYADYYLEAYKAPAPEELLDAMRSLEEEALSASA